MKDKDRKDIKDTKDGEARGETKNRKPLRPNPIAAWELRIGRFRVFYEGGPVARRVMVQAVGNKEHNKLFVRGNEVKL